MNAVKLKKYLYSIYRPGHISLFILSLLYGIIVIIRRWIIRGIRIPECRVVSIGNISTGGSGKTPLVIELSKKLLKLRKRVAVLTRGYGRKNKAAIIIQNGHSNIDSSGDEPDIIHRNSGVPVVVGKDRISSIELAIHNFGTEIAILDDGFQYLKLSKDLNIIVIDTLDPFSNSFMLPRGFLREPLFVLKNADAFILSRANLSDNLDYIQKRIIKYKSDAVIFRSYLKPEKIVNEGHKIDIELIKNKNILAFCGIGNPDSLFKLLKDEAGVKSIKMQIFPDHYKYTAQDLAEIEEKGKKYDYIITTEKDAVNCNYHFPYITISSITPGLDKWVLEKLSVV